MSQNTLENIVLVILIGLGIGLGILYRTKGDDQLSAILFSLAFAAVLYKFLGGSQEDNSLSVGVIKFGGSAAVLGGFIWLLSQVIFAGGAIDFPTAGLLNFRSVPSTGWYIADTKTGEPIQVNIEVGDSTLQLPMHKVRTDRLKTRRYELNEFEKEHFALSPLGNSGDTLGQIYLDDIKGESVSGGFGELKASDAFLFKLYPNVRGRRNSVEVENKLVQSGQRESIFPFPFIIKTYGTLFSVKKRDTKEAIVSDREVARSNPFIIPEKKADGTMDYWVLDVVHANSLTADNTQHYSEWSIHRISSESK